MIISLGVIAFLHYDLGTMCLSFFCSGDSTLCLLKEICFGALICSNGGIMKDLLFLIKLLFETGSLFLDSRFFLFSTEEINEDCVDLCKIIAGLDR